MVQKSLDPEWNEVFVLLLADMPGDLFLDVFDYDLIGSNDFLGRCACPPFLYPPVALYGGFVKDE